MRELSLNVMDIAQNSVRAEAEVIEIRCLENTVDNTLVIEIQDNGKGMTKEQVQNVTDPFFTTRTTRKVGLGVPLFKMAAEQTGGNFEIKSELGQGTLTRAVFKTDNVDMTPLGDINSTISILIRCNPNTQIVYTRSRDDKTFTLDTRELKQILGEVPLDNPDVMEWIEAFLKENEENIFGGANQ
jgi:anti-sigma regulatory factor (Ser/Thr protein kinase)